MCEQNTAPRVSQHVPRTHIFLVCTWLKMCVLYCVLSFLIVIPSLPCFVARCVMHLSLTILFSISDTNTQSDDYSFAALFLTAGSPQGGLLFGRLAEQSPLTCPKLEPHRNEWRSEATDVDGSLHGTGQRMPNVQNHKTVLSRSSS